jgi:hypothetical protein
VRDLHVQSLDDNPTTLFGGNLSGASIRFGPVKVIPGERPVGRPFGDLAIDIDNWRRDYTSGKAVRTHGFHVRVNNNDSSLVVDSLLLRSPREYDYIVKGVRFSYRSMELGISWFSIAPSLNDNAFFARQKYRGDRFRISAGPVVLRDIDFDALARREAFHVTTVDVQSLDVNLVSNVALPKNPCAYEKHRSSMESAGRGPQIRQRSGGTICPCSPRTARTRPRTPANHFASLSRGSL